MTDYLYEPCIDLIEAVLRKAAADWHKTCSLDLAHSKRVLAALGERRDEYGNYTGGVTDICEFCHPYGGPRRELLSFFRSDWCGFLYSTRSVHRDTSVRELQIC